MDKITLEKHIDKLILQSDISFMQVVDPLDAEYCYDYNSGWIREISAPGATSDRDYYATLHEIGHIHTCDTSTLAPQGRYVNDANALAHEAAAWRWAIANSLVPMNDDVRALIVYCLGSYKKAAPQLEQDKPLAQDFHTLLAELEDGTL